MITDEELEAIEHRSERFIARMTGKQEGSTSLAAQISAMDVPDLLAEVKRLKAAVRPSVDEDTAALSRRMVGDKP